jgi:adenylate kinase family enzyme
MKKIIIVGCPGSGKSTLARTLRDKLNLPLYHLDLIFWNPDGTNIPKQEFKERLQEIIDTDEWIIDGNYNSTMEMRMQASDTVIFLDYPTEICLAGISARKGKPRSDMAWISPDDDDAEFIEFVKDYNTNSRPYVLN